MQEDLKNLLKNTSFQILSTSITVFYLKNFLQSQIKKQQSKNSKTQNNKLQKKCIGIEVGGTGISVAYAVQNYDQNNQLINVDIQEKQYFRTFQNPEQTMDQILEFTKKYEYEHVGIASFGPICLNKQDLQYGSITTTPKQGWKDFQMISYVKKILNFNNNIGFDTDVNACALAEYKLSKSYKTSLVYITVGTGVGAGLIINGKPVHGMMHPEGGHMMIPKHEKDQNFVGVCSYHQNCLEGMVTNVSIAKRKGIQDVMEIKNLKDDDEVWDLVAHYLSVFCANIAYICSPEVIVLGGGIMNRTILYEKIRNKLNDTFKDYLVLYKTTAQDFIQPPKLGNNVGVIGATIL